MTIDKRRRAPGTLPAFTAVPRHYNRHDGWTEERQRGFIEALAETGSVKAAAHAVNMTPESAYQLRRHAQAAEFRRAWEAALALGVQRLEDTAMERALHGQQVPVYSYGKLIGTRTVYNDRLLMFLLRNRAPTRFAADGRVTARRSALNDPFAAGRLARLKKQWRKEWEAEREAREARDGEAIVQSINAKLEGMRSRYLEDMTSRARAAHDEWQRVMAEDEEAGRSRRTEEEEEEEQEADDPDDPADPCLPRLTHFSEGRRER